MDTATPPLPRPLLIGRQPILDRAQQLVGYALRFRGPGQSAASAGVVGAAWAGLGLGTALGPLRARIDADERFVLDDLSELQPAAGIVLALDFAGAADAALLARCRTLRERGYTLALARYAGPDERSDALLPLVDIAAIDAQENAERLAELAGGLAGLPLQILAGNVGTREQMERCRAAGCQLFQGDYVTRPTIVRGRQLSASQLGIIRLLNLVAREADSTDLEENFKREPGLTVNLLRLVNAVGIGVVRKVDSLRHAIAVLGRKQLLRWLQLLLMASSGGGEAPERNPLLQLAAGRGRLLEILAGRLSPGKRTLGDEAFLAGIMSLMPAALGLPMDEILAQIPVVDDVRHALAAHEGELGRLLALVERLDAADWDGCDALLGELPALSHDALNRSLVDALAWIHGESGDD
ncbi:EAL and HDOD domain-containing protein [Azospira restricta]|uniref:HDOD domain-containing protein n=1 Tax=Azospira restricta TaxID=404405 RepID=A0A974Y5C5_9RHOO|nr:HDOD domain-containing protein [Azospira restricta]QRJ65280.1 HDOD domain-containing protein [Azospira restricta]